MLKRRCENCKKIFYTYPSKVLGKSGHTKKFCSRVCYSSIRNKNLIKNGKKTRYKKGDIPFSKLHPERMPHGSKHINWKGQKVGYRGLHYWLYKVKGVPVKCTTCDIKRTTPKNMHWANIDHRYRRNPKDYISLCNSCHKLYDLKRFH